MEDRIFLTNNHSTNGISDTFRQFIEALVEEVVLEGEPFDTQKKWLSKYSESEGVNCETIERNLNDLFEALKELEEHKSKIVERSVRALAKDCYLSETTINKLIEKTVAARVQKEKAAKDALEKQEREKREVAVRKAREEAEKKAKEEEKRIAQAEMNRRIAENILREEKERKGREIAVRKALEEAEKKAKEEEKKKLQEKAEKERKEKEEKEKSDNLEKKIKENLKKLQALEEKANAMMDSVAKRQQVDNKTLESLNELSRQLRDYLDKTKQPISSSSPSVRPIDANWPATFIEQLRQAYCRKDLVFLANAFSTNAQIITGAFEKSTIRYRTQGKQQYVANLRYIFGRNKTINVKFESDSLTGTLYSSVDGRCQVIRLMQRWTSDKYSDSGYILFVLYFGENGPKVYIRAWQPEFIGGRHITVQELNGINNITGLR